MNCSGTLALTAAWAACGRWSTHASSEGGLQPRYIHHRWPNNVAFWRFSVCTACLGKGRREFLENARKQETRSMLVLPGVGVALLIGTVLLWGLSIGMRAEPSGTSPMVYLVMGTALVAGLAGLGLTILALINIPIALRKLAGYRSALAALERGDAVADADVATAYVGYAQLMLKSLEGGNDLGAVSLPANRPGDHIVDGKSFPANKPATFEVLAAAGSEESLRSALGDEWKAVLIGNPAAAIRP